MHQDTLASLGGLVNPVEDVIHLGEREWSASFHHRNSEVGMKYQSIPEVEEKPNCEFVPCPSFGHYYDHCPFPFA